MQVQSSGCNSKKRGRKKYIMAVYKGNKANQKDFKWTDDEAELLLSVTFGVYTYRKVERFKNAPLSYSFTFIVVLSIRFAVLLLV